MSYNVSIGTSACIDKCEQCHCHKPYFFELVSEKGIIKNTYCVKRYTNLIEVEK